MSVALEVRNDSQLIQIDGELPLFGLAASGTTSSTQITIGGLSAPIMAISGTGWVYGSTNSGSTYTWTLITDGNPVDYYVFDLAAGIPSASGCGLELFDGQGRLIYSSAAKPMNIIGQTVASNDSYGVLASYPSRRLAVVTNGQPPSRIEYTYYGSPYDPYGYGEDSNITYYAPSTPRRDQGVTGYVSAEITGYDYSSNPEAGRGDPPYRPPYYGGQWDFYTIDVSAFE